MVCCHTAGSDPVVPESKGITEGLKLATIQYIWRKKRENTGRNVAICSTARNLPVFMLIVLQSQNKVVGSLLVGIWWKTVCGNISIKSCFPFIFFAPIGQRFSATKEIYENGLLKWNSEIQNLTSPTPRSPHGLTQSHGTIAD